MMKPLIFRAAVLALALLGAAQAAPLKILVPATSGSSHDVFANAVANALEKSGLAPNVNVVVNGAQGGRAALGEVMAGRGNSQLLIVVGQSTTGGMLALNAQGVPVSYQTFTPVARLATSSTVITVRSTSPWKTTAQLMKALSANPAKIAFSGTPMGSSGHIAAVTLGRAVGVPAKQVRFVPSNGAAKAAKAMLAGELDVVIGGYSALEDLIAAGKLRPLAVIGSQRIEGLNVATLSEQGVGVDLSEWLGVMAAPGISAQDRAALGDLFAKLSKTKEWQAELRANRWTDASLGGDSFTTFLDSETFQMGETMRDLGILK